MKITKRQLRKIIKEERIKLLKEQYQYDAQTEIYDIQQHLSDAAMKLMELAAHLENSDGRRAIQFDSLSRQVEKIKGIVETHVRALEGSTS